jgi:sulfide:quinone oxidoreductase
MRIVEITPDYSVSPQIAVADVATIKGLGFRSIMCNRPDGEEPGQPEVAEVRAEAERLGLTFTWVPVISGGITEGNVADFSAALGDLPAPVLAYCRSGGRCQNLWMLAGHGRATRAR